jgi:hypothetical protein
MRLVVSAIKKWLFRSKSLTNESNTFRAEPSARSDATLAPSNGDIKATFTLHQPLLDALRSFERTKLSKGMILFHGCNSSSAHTDCENHRLLGTRKWFSQDASYAVDYSCSYSGLPDRKLLWVCEVKTEVPALFGSQFSLKSVSPWDGAFPWKFPSAYEEYARHILETDQSVALLDHKSGDIFGEILITSPSEAIQVIEVREVPDDIASARKLGFELNTEYRRT